MSQEKQSSRGEKPPVPHDLRLAYNILRAANLASISRSQIYVEINENRLRAVKIGGRTVVLHEDLMGWLKSRPRK